jgi:hypothetical protein
MIATGNVGRIVINPRIAAPGHQPTARLNEALRKTLRLKMHGLCTDNARLDGYKIFSVRGNNSQLVIALSFAVTEYEYQGGPHVGEQEALSRLSGATNNLVMTLASMLRRSFAFTATELDRDFVGTLDRFSGKIARTPHNYESNTQMAAILIKLK